MARERAVATECKKFGGKERMAEPLRAGPVSEARGRAPQLSGLPLSRRVRALSSNQAARGTEPRGRPLSVVYHPCRSGPGKLIDSRQRQPSLYLNLFGPIKSPESEASSIMRPGE
eukprot:663815-Hanusia_phi.AAC.1